MAKERPLPRHSLARNLKQLLAQSEMTATVLALKAGVDRKTINNQLNGRFDPRPEQVDKVAMIFGLNHWDLLSDKFDVALAKNKDLQRLLELYAKANKKDRESILRIAEMTRQPKP